MYIYLNFKDLSEETRCRILDIAREEVKNETTQEEADDMGVELDDLIDERIDNKLISMSHEGRFVFNT